MRLKNEQLSQDVDIKNKELDIEFWKNKKRI